jgi:hypothetical protein
MHVVGIEVEESEFPSGTTPDYELYTTDAFAHSVLPNSAAYVSYLVRLRHGQSDFALFQAEDRSLGWGGSGNLNTPMVLLESAVHPQAVGWWALARFFALVFSPLMLVPENGLRAISPPGRGGLYKRARLALVHPSSR